MHLPDLRVHRLGMAEHWLRDFDDDADHFTYKLQADRVQCDSLGQQDCDLERTLVPTFPSEQNAA